jgi:hypothetical protein
MAIRRPADWMQASDDRILEYLDSMGDGGPSSIIDDGDFDFHRKTVGRRLRLLSKAGLVERVGRGVYRISNKGRRYLAGQEDLRDEPKPE